MLLFSFMMASLSHVCIIIKMHIVIGVIFKGACEPLRVSILTVVRSGIESVYLVSTPPSELMIPIRIINVKKPLLSLLTRVLMLDLLGHRLCLFIFLVFFLIFFILVVELVISIQYFLVLLFSFILWLSKSIFLQLLFQVITMLMGEFLFFGFNLVYSLGFCFSF